MTRLKFILLVSAIALFALACATNTNTNTVTNSNHAATNSTVSTNTAAPAATTDALAEARTTYDAACVKCHKANGEGGVADLEGEKLRVPSFKGGHALKHTDAEYNKQIAEGGEGMPAFKKRLTPEQINAQVRFIRAEFQTGLNVGGASNTNK